jgi:bifunctional dethiobiotin synthetase / adenosylmethionine---8-amino-7-oxononanoate aminotransferase
VQLPHVPIIFDEVFTGIYRLGRFNCNGLVGAHPDIVVNAKLLTGGVVPLCTTTASAEIFEAFIGDSKTDCLLHGHSYTAHPVGCSVAIEALDAYKGMEESGHWVNLFSRSWAAVNTEHEHPVWSVWDPVFIEKLSFLDDVEGVVALGTVLAMTLKDSTGGGTRSNTARTAADWIGYSSSAAADLQKRLMLHGEDDGVPIHSRVLGNVIYFITSLTVEPQDVDQIQTRIVTEVQRRS